VAAALVAADSRVAARLRVAGVGVDDTDEAQAATARRRATDEGPVLCAGRFADVKGTGDLASLVPRLAARGGGAHVVVAGGVPGNRRADARWRRRLAATGAELCGWLDAGALAAQYARARVLVVPSRAETFGLVAVEGMLHGLPVVATAAGGLVEIVEHDHTGLVCPPGDVEAIATAVGALLDDGARALRLGQTAARVVRERHLWAYVLPAWIAIYRSAQG
jgi:glycogen(starch) synthase